jgi:hypothetical protein
MAQIPGIRITAIVLILAMAHTMQAFPSIWMPHGFHYRHNLLKHQKDQNSLIL